MECQIGEISEKNQTLLFVNLEGVNKKVDCGECKSCKDVVPIVGKCSDCKENYKHEETYEDKKGFLNFIYICKCGKAKKILKPVS